MKGGSKTAHFQFKTFMETFKLKGNGVHQNLQFMRLKIVMQLLNIHYLSKKMLFPPVSVYALFRCNS